MRIAIIGAGGVGGYFGGRLAQAGEDILWAARGAHLEAMQSEGLRVQSILGDFTIQPVRAAASPTPDLFQSGPGAADVVLVCVKAWQIAETVPTMAPLLDDHTLIVPLCNGLEAAKTLRRAIPAGQVIEGLCRISAFIAAPGEIRHAGIKPTVTFGAVDGQKTQRMLDLLAAFTHADVQAQIPDDILREVWLKFLFVSATAGIGAATRSPVGVVRSVPGVRRRVETALGELITLAPACKVRLPGNTMERTLAFIDSLTPSIMPSMQHDIMAGRPSELEALIGVVVRLGAEYNCPTPTYHFLYDCLLPQEMTARGQIKI